MSTTEAEEKGAIESLGIAAPSTPRTAGSDICDDAIDPVAEKKLLRKLDLIIFPTFFIIYMMSFLDRINIGNARIQGMTEELHLTGNRFNVALLVSHTSPVILSSP